MEMVASMLNSAGQASSSIFWLFGSSFIPPLQFFTVPQSMIRLPAWARHSFRFYRVSVMYQRTFCIKAKRCPQRNSQVLWGRKSGSAIRRNGHCCASDYTSASYSCKPGWGFNLPFLRKSEAWYGSNKKGCLLWAGLLRVQ